MHNIYFFVCLIDSRSLPLALLPGVCSGGGQGDPPDTLNGLTCNLLSLTWSGRQYIHIHVNSYMHKVTMSIHIYIYIYVYVCMYVYKHTYIYIYIHIYIYIYAGMMKGDLVWH